MTNDIIIFFLKKKLYNCVATFTLPFFLLAE